MWVEVVARACRATALSGQCSSRPRRSAVDDAIAIEVTGVTCGYVAGIKAAAPWIGGLFADEAVAMKALG